MSNKTINPSISAEELLTILPNNNLVLIDTRIGRDIKATLFFLSFN